MSDIGLAKVIDHEIAPSGLFRELYRPYSDELNAVLALQELGHIKSTYDRALKVLSDDRPLDHPIRLWAERKHAARINYPFPFVVATRMWACYTIELDLYRDYRHLMKIMPRPRAMRLPVPLLNSVISKV